MPKPQNYYPDQHGDLGTFRQDDSAAGGGSGSSRSRGSRGGGRGGAPSGPSRKERRQSQRDEDEREKRRAARKEKEGGEKSKIQWMPLLFLFFIVGPGIMPAVLWAGDYVADTSLGKSIAAGCADIGLCRSYEQQLTDLYMQNNPKKVKEVPRLLRKWIGKEDKLIAEVTAKYEQKRRREAIIKAAKERDRAAGYGDDAETTDTRRDSKQGRDSSGSKPKPTKPAPKASGWDDEPAADAGDVPAWDDEEDEDADDIMAEMLKDDADL